MPHEIARYEFRSFAPDFGQVEQRLRAAGGVPQIRDSAEFYLVSRPDEIHNVKIRAGCLDIKVLLQTTAGLEQWDPRFKLPFPLADAAVAEVLLPALAVNAELPAGAGASIGRLVEEFRGRPHGVVVVDVHKRRTGFLVGECIAEIVEVTFDGAALRSICVESTEPDRVRRVITELGLDAHLNLSYLTAVRCMVGFDDPARLQDASQRGKA